jgi:hypothetical protein
MTMSAPWSIGRIKNPPAPAVLSLYISLVKDHLGGIVALTRRGERRLCELLPRDA